MKRTFVLLAALIALAVPASALATGTAPSAVGAAAFLQTKTTLSLKLTSPPSCDADGDFGWNSGAGTFAGYYEFQLNGTLYATLTGNGSDPGFLNCGLAWTSINAQQYSGLTCNTSYTLRVRPVDDAGHHGAFTSVGGTAGAKTLAC